MKIIRYYEWGELPPWYMGRWYVDYCRNQGVYAMIPFNWPLAFIRWMWLVARLTAPFFGLQAKLDEKRRHLIQQLSYLDERTLYVTGLIHDKERA